MHEFPMPEGIDLQRVIDTNWNKSWALSKTSTAPEMTPAMLNELAEIGEGSVHYPDGTFNELSTEQTKAWLRRFCDGEKLEGTVKLAVGTTEETTLVNWKNVFPGANVRVNYFLSTGPAKGIRPHYDNHHVFAVQLIGEKTWGLGPKVAVTSPEAPSFYPEVDPPIEATIQTKVGDVLYIPPGGWHGAETEERSMHATVGIYPPTYAEYLRQLISSRAGSDVVLRSELPVVQSNIEAGVRFGAPSLAITKELTDRVARVSLDARTSLSTKMNLPQGEELTDEVLKLTRSIWDEAEAYGRVGLYLRGSVARPSVPGIRPWDIDLALITRRVVPEEARRTARNETDGLELDMKYVTVHDLINADRELPTRSLLRSEGVLLFGQDIVCEIPLAKPSLGMAAVIASRQAEACRVNDAEMRSGVDDSVMIRRFAKAALRLATPFIMLQLNRLERDPVICGWFISANYPNLREAADYLIASVRGANDLSEVQAMCRLLLNHLQGDLAKVEERAHAG
jgi:hypothetical protein